MLAIKRKQPKLYKNSRALDVLAALVNETLEIGAILAEAGVPKTMSGMEWRIMHGKTIKAPKIDLNKMRAVASERRAYHRALKRVLDRREAKLVKKKGRWIVVVTEHGRRRLIESAFQDLAIARPAVWDGRWRMVLYDLPIAYDGQRDTFRNRLNQLGFFPIQKSVFVLPYPCEDELDALIQHLGIGKFVTFFSTDSLGSHEAEALFYFGLEPTFK